MRVVVLGLLLAAAAPAVAAALSETSAARYAFVPVPAGALRLDTETGEVSLCVGGAQAPSCTRVSENVRLTVGERAKLEAKVEALEARLAELEAHARAAAPPAAGEMAMERVKILAARLMNHFVDAVQMVKQDLRRSWL